MPVRYIRKRVDMHCYVYAMFKVISNTFKLRLGQAQQNQTCLQWAP